MKVSWFLKTVDLLGLNLVFWNEKYETEPLWSGSYMDVPWWIADMEIAEKYNNDPPISFRNDLGEEYDNKPGFVIIVKEED